MAFAHDIGGLGKASEVIVIGNADLYQYVLLQQELLRYPYPYRTQQLHWATSLVGFLGAAEIAVIEVHSINISIKSSKSGWRRLALVPHTSDIVHRGKWKTTLEGANR